MRLMLTGFALLHLSLPLCAQETRSMIYGHVLDPQSGAVIGANVKVTNTDTNTSVALTTNETGYYEASLLLPGNYRVSAEASGFKTSIRSGLVLPVSTRLEINLGLVLGEVAESVSVVAEAPILDTSTVSSGAVLDTRSIMDLPTMGNNPMLLIMQTPGIQTSGQNRYVMQGFYIRSSEYYMPGAIGGNEWSIDGTPNAGPNRNAAYMPYTDTIQEFKVETSNFDAAVGHTTGINVAMMTKTGTNALHGTVTEQHWEKRWNGSPFFVKKLYYQKIAAARAAGDTALADRLRSQDIQPSGHDNNYVFTVGGPVVLPKIYNGRNKLFFFFSYAGVKDINSEDPSGINQTVPNMADRAGDFSRLLLVDATRYQIYDPLSVRPDPARPTHYIRDPIPGNILPASRVVNPAYKSYVSFLPTPNNDPLNPGGQPNNNYISAGQPYNEDYWAATNRMDYNLSGKHRFYGRWAWNKLIENRGDWTYESAPGLNSNNLYRENRGGTIDWVYSPSASTVLDFNAGINDFIEAYKWMTAVKYKPSDVGLPAYLDEKAGDHTILPQMSFSGYTGFGASYPSYTHFRSLDTKADLSHIRGSHSMHAGFDMRQHFRTASAGGLTSGAFSFDTQYTRRNDDTFTPAGSYGLSWAAFMMGIPSGMSIDTNDSFATHNPYYAWFFQDTWRVSRKLSLNVGLRLEYEGGPTERFNRMLTYFDPTVKLEITDAALAAYAANPRAEVDPKDFKVQGGAVYAGTNGASRKAWRNELMWLPRFSAAYQLDSQTVIRAGYGMFYDTLNVLNLSPDQLGYSRNTSTTLTNDYGVHWLVGDPAAGISPLTDPFPVRADGTRFNEPFKNTLGPVTVAGRGFTFNAYDTEHGRVQRWRAGVQRQLSTNAVLEVAYAGSYGDRLSISRRLDALPEQYWASGLTRNDAVATDMNLNVPNPFYIGNYASLQTSNPVLYQRLTTLGFFTSSTIRKNQLLRPYPAANGLYQANFPYGEAIHHALEVTAQRRFSKGFTFNIGYTMMTDKKKDWVLDEFALPTDWITTQNARPHRLVGTGIYQFPFGKGRKFWQTGILNHVFGGWQFSATYEWQPGPLLEFGNLFYYGDISDINTGTRTFDHWFNTANFETSASKGPNSFHRRVFQPRIDGLRADMTNQWNTNILREFTIRERYALQFRLDALNLQNRSQMNAPVVDPYSKDFAKVTSQTSSTNRFIQIQVRLRF
jgi:hypothetical protein